MWRMQRAFSFCFWCFVLFFCGKNLSYPPWGHIKWYPHAAPVNNTVHLHVISNKRCHIAFSLASIYCTVQMATVIYSTKQYTLVQLMCLWIYSRYYVICRHIYTDIFFTLSKISLPGDQLHVDQKHFSASLSTPSSSGHTMALASVQVDAVWGSILHVPRFLWHRRNKRKKKKDLCRVLFLKSQTGAITDAIAE